MCSDFFACLSGVAIMGTAVRGALSGPEAGTFLRALGEMQLPDLCSKLVLPPIYLCVPRLFPDPSILLLSSFFLAGTGERSN